MKSARSLAQALGRIRIQPTSQIVGIDLAQTALNAVPGIVAAVLSAALSARWALARFRSEKWWERKVETYTEIAKALFLVKRYVDDWVNSYETHEERSEEYRKTLLDDWHVGSRAVEEATVIGTFVISPGAASVLAELQKAKRGGDPDDPYDQARHESDALDAAIPAFVAAARRDLGIEDTPGGWFAVLRPNESLKLTAGLRSAAAAPPLG